MRYFEYCLTFREFFRLLHNTIRLYDKTPLCRFTWLLLLFLTTGATSQPLLRLNSIAYNVNEGLLQSHVADIAEDGNGFIWISTGSGVQRFDGKRFHQVMPGSSSTSLPEDRYVHFLRLNDGNLWITHNKGITEYDIHTNSFKKVYEFETIARGNSLADNLIYAVLEEGPLVWCATPHGLLAISRQTRQVTDSIHYAPIAGLELASPLSPIQNFFVAAGKNICAFLAPAELRIINTDTKRITTVKASREQKAFYAIEKLTDDTLLVASSLGIEKMSVANNRFSFVCSYIIPPERDHQRFPLHLFRLRNDHCIVVFSGEVFELDTNTGQYRARLVNLQHQSFLNNGFINGCMSDRFHNLWLVTVSDGVKKINYNFSGFRYFGTADRKNNFVKAVYVDKAANQVFCGTFNSGLYVYDTSQQLIRHVDAFPGSPAPYTVCAIDKAGPQQYLVYLTGSWDAYLLNTHDFSIRKLPVHIDRPSPVDKFDYYLSQLKTADSATLISTFFSLYEARFLNGALQLQRLDSLPAPAICAYTDRKGQVWVGGAGSYFLLHHGEPPRSFSLPGKILCRCFWNDRMGRLWMGTEKGLFRLNNDGSILSVLHRADGLPDDCIYAIREDRKGNLWFSHNKGLTCMGRSGSLLHFSKNDGLQENEFNTNTSFETADGELYFGGVNGISSFYPEAVSNINEMPNVLLSGIKVNDEYWKEDTAYWSIQQLQLPYYNNIVSFEFTALGLRNPDQYNFQYQMEGLDPDWINAGSYPAPRYVLSPGKYLFRYYAGNSLDKHTLKYKELIVIINPPFWKTWWFTMLLVIAVVAMLFFVIKTYSTRARLRHNRELETHRKIQQERERISRELHDNIGSQLSFISSSIDWISAPPMQMSKEDELKRLATINDTAKLVINDLRETIWALKKEAIPLDEMADRLKLFIQLQRTLRPEMEMTITEDIRNNISFSSTEALNIFRICQEAIVNCIRHADAGKLGVSIQSGPGKAFIITIEDNGKGFSDTPRTPEHYGLENMQHRAAELGALLLIKSGEGKGTTLVLRNV